MDSSNIPPYVSESMRRRIEELERQPPIDAVRLSLGGHLGDAESIEEARQDFAMTAKYTVRGLRRNLRALERVLAEPQPPGLLANLVAWDANWVLDDPSDAAAAAFLWQIAMMLREVIDEAGGPEAR